MEYLCRNRSFSQDLQDFQGAHSFYAGQLVQFAVLILIAEPLLPEQIVSFQKFKLKTFLS